MGRAAGNGVKVTSGLGEELHESTILRGMPLLVVPKRGFRKTYALIGTAYGSIDNDFTSSVAGRRTRLPAGIAHFLEHKMFEKEEGDVMDVLAGLGCSSNAMTSFNHTGYLIECTTEFDACLEILVDFVTRPYFTPELVEKEKGIIAEEINMYRDDPGWRGFMGVLANLYRKHPVAIDIAGTVESIAEITADDLTLCHATFYSPENMHLAVAGDVDVRRVRDVAARVLERNCDPEPVSVDRHRPRTPRRIARRRSREAMPLAGPKLHLGWMIDVESFDDPFAMETALELFLSALLSRSGALHRRLYEAGLIDDSFSYSIYVEPEFAFLMLAGDTPDPKALERELIAGLDAAQRDGFTTADLRRARRRMYGSFVRSFDSVSSICWNMVDFHAKRRRFVDYVDVLMKIPVSRVVELAGRALRPDFWASHVLVPEPARP